MTFTQPLSPDPFPKLTVALAIAYLIGLFSVLSSLKRNPPHRDFFTHTKAAELLATGQWKLAPDDPHQCWVGMVRLERLD